MQKLKHVITAPLYLAALSVSAAALVFVPVMAVAQDDFVIEMDDSEDDGFVIEMDDAADEAEEFVIEMDEVEDDADEFVIEVDEATDDAEEFVIEMDDAADEAEEFVIETEDAMDEPELIVDVEEDAEADDFVIEMDEPEADSVEDDFFSREPADDDAMASAAQGSQMPMDSFEVGLDEVRFELAPLLDNDDAIDGFVYAQALVSAHWQSGLNFEAFASVEVEAYIESGSGDADEKRIALDETYLRYNGDNLRVTLGNQTVIWGRIDELPPIDRLSSQDQLRFILDDLPDRRQARPMLRIESFFGENKLDLLYAPTFMEAQLPEEGAIWHPIDQRRGDCASIKVGA